MICLYAAIAFWFFCFQSSLATLEDALIELVSAKQRELWKQENQNAIAAYNQIIEENGTFSDDLRAF